MSFLEKLEQAENALDKDVKSWKQEREKAIKNIKAGTRVKNRLACQRCEFHKTVHCK